MNNLTPEFIQRLQLNPEDGNDWVCPRPYHALCKKHVIKVYSNTLAFAPDGSLSAKPIHSYEVVNLSMPLGIMTEVNVVNIMTIPFYLYAKEYLSIPDKTPIAAISINAVLEDDSVVPWVIINLSKPFIANSSDPLELKAVFNARLTPLSVITNGSNTPISKVNEYVTLAHTAAVTKLGTEVPAMSTVTQLADKATEVMNDPSKDKSAIAKSQIGVKNTIQWNPDNHTMSFSMTNDAGIALAIKTLYLPFALDMGIFFHVNEVALIGTSTRSEVLNLQPNQTLKLTFTIELIEVI